MQPFYAIESEWRIRQWLSGGIHDFGPYDEEDAKKLDDYLNSIELDWPK